MDGPGAGGGPTPDADLNQVLQELVPGIRALVGANFVGAYLQGSLAHGGWDADSDVDFAVVLEQDLPESDLPALQALHAQVYGRASYWAQHLEGSYFPRAVLRSGERAGEPLWYLNNGRRELVRSNHCNTLVVRWVLRECGVRLAGPEPRGT